MYKAKLHVQSQAPSNVWKHLEASRSIWRHLGGIWEASGKHLGSISEASGDIWKHLEAYGNIWEASGSICKASGGIWEASGLLDGGWTVPRRRAAGIRRNPPEDWTRPGRRCGQWIPEESFASQVRTPYEAYMQSSQMPHPSTSGSSIAARYESSLLFWSWLWTHHDKVRTEYMYGLSRALVCFLGAALTPNLRLGHRERAKHAGWDHRMPLRH